MKKKNGKNLCWPNGDTFAIICSHTIKDSSDSSVSSVRQITEGWFTSTVDFLCRLSQFMIAVYMGNERGKSSMHVSSIGKMMSCVFAYDWCLSICLHLLTMLCLRNGTLQFNATSAVYMHKSVFSKLWNRYETETTRKRKVSKYCLYKSQPRQSI